MITTVTTELRAPQARIIFSVDPPGKPPAVDYDVLGQLEDAITIIASAGPEIRLVLVESTEPEYFVVGANLKALQQIDSQSIRPWVRRGHNVFNMLQELELPVIALVRGFTGGGGLELALACDFIYAADNARFALPEAGLGLIPGWGGSHRLPLRIGAARAKELAFSARPIEAPTAYNWGLINYYGPEEELQQKLAALTESISANSRISVAMEKQLINSALSPDNPRMKFEEAAASTAAMGSSDTSRRLEEFFEKRSRK
ncbi:enoyl-CoA hydratase/isomerase family protein [Marispirochaeta sp.]|uniref:enoyl-CoA hydratase/isomerase family protein n=1 Tax=Marispirochaeta sp. TaxID=2038653 RepID=UPI0029C78F0B|nr:enoyl-CoA hydratase/isomerase family protein [Marispirochaeta sp.]